MTTSDLLSTLKSLECELHVPTARSDRHRLDALLHDAFLEFGRSGAAYRKQDILDRLPATRDHACVVADRFELRCLGEEAALLRYRAAHRLADGRLDRFTLRSSVWEKSAQGWQMSFHQGTPTEAYEPDVKGPGES